MLLRSRDRKDPLPKRVVAARTQPHTTPFSRGSVTHRDTKASAADAAGVSPRYRCAAKHFLGMIDSLSTL